MDAPVAAEAESPRIQSLARADAILSAVMSNGNPISLSALAKTLGLNKTTVFNLAESLVVMGYLARTASPKGYKLGLRCLELGRYVTKNLPILEVSRTSLRELCRTTNETVNLAVPYLQAAILVEALQSQQCVRATAYAGARSNYHSSACGKAILAYFPEERRNWIYKRVGLKRMTAFTITDRTVLERQLADVRENGFATEEQENELGASCVAVPILGPFNEVVASISITGVTHRMKRERIVDILAELQAHSDRISQKLR
ncbi:MAG: IclR family transcriptional regulator [Albidovulum sp.]|nr:IclR family transcriptional regulator [Albidovulum sp.]